MITAFLPCRKGSQRIVDKNVKAFAGLEGGLLNIKINQLINTKCIDKIIVSSNDERVLDFASKIKEERISIDERPNHLGSNETSTDQLINYVPSIITAGHVLWTHVTSPFINEDDYALLILKYLKILDEGFDSLMTVQEIRGFLWKNTQPLNYDREKERWPRTQTIEPVYEVDSGAFISPISNYLVLKDRIGKNPFLYVHSKLKALDIDWPEDFDMAEFVWKYKFLNR